MIKPVAYIDFHIGGGGILYETVGQRGAREWDDRGSVEYDMHVVCPSTPNENISTAIMIIFFKKHTFLYFLTKMEVYYRILFLSSPTNEFV